ncbi:MAG: hypothetical protein WCR85_00115 [Sphaerochaeta sp.]
MQINDGNQVIDVDDGMYCSIALDEALNSLCQGSESAFREVALSFFGFTQDDLNRLFPIEEKYRDILEDGLIDGQCTDYSEVRTYILALAWDKVKDAGSTPKQAIQEAWSDVRLICEGFGVGI